MHKFVRVLDNPPPIQEQTSQVSRFWGQSHGLTMRHKNLMINRFTSQWNTLFEYFHFCLEKLIFMRHLCRNPQFLGIFISIRHIWSSCWQDKCQIRLSLQRCQPLETLNQETVFFSLPPPRDFQWTPSPPSPENWPSPQWEWLGTLYEVLHDTHTIKIRNHCFYATNNLCQWLNTCKNAPETVLRIRKIQVLS